MGGEKRYLFSLEGGGEDHAGGWAAVGQQFLDQILQLGDRRKYDLQQKGVAAGEVMAFLNGLECRNKFQERPVPIAVAGKPDERSDGESHCLQIDLSPVAADQLEALQAANTLCRGGRGELNAPAQFGDREAGVGAELLHYFFVDQIGSVMLKHSITPRERIEN